MDHRRIVTVSRYRSVRSWQRCVRNTVRDRAAGVALADALTLLPQVAWGCDPPEGMHATTNQQSAEESHA
jgi:hypothetical protein